MIAEGGFGKIKIETFNKKRFIVKRQYFKQSDTAKYFKDMKANKY